MTNAIRPRGTLPPDYFEGVYAAHPDPWGFETSDYERAKYEATLHALPQPRYARALEIGCSIGVLTARLAEHCDELLAVDVNATALARARARCAVLAHVRFATMRVPEELPAPAGAPLFDLVLLSEVAYYWSPPDLDRFVDWLQRALASQGALVMVHWTHVVPDYPQTGDAVHEQVAKRLSASGWSCVRHDRQPDYRLDVFAAP